MQVTVLTLPMVPVCQTPPVSWPDALVSQPQPPSVLQFWSSTPLAGSRSSPASRTLLKFLSSPQFAGSGERVVVLLITIPDVNPPLFVSKFHGAWMPVLRVPPCVRSDQVTLSKR